MIMKPILIRSLATGIIIFLTATANADDNRHTFKGATLGMSIEAFRAMAFPDVGKKPGYGKFVPKVFRVQCAPASELLTNCWFEAWSVERAPVCEMDAKELKAHVKRLNRSAYRKVLVKISDFQKTCFRRIDVGYAGYSPSYDSDITYYFHGGRLMEIDIGVRPGDVNLLYPKLVIAYGSPTHESKPVASNRFGAKFQNFVAEWRGDEDMIILKRYNGKTNIGQFTFLHRPTVAQYRVSKARVTQSAVKDF